MTDNRLQVRLRRVDQSDRQARFALCPDGRAPVSPLAGRVLGFTKPGTAALRPQPPNATTPFFSPAVTTREMEIYSLRIRSLR